MSAKDKSGPPIKTPVVLNIDVLIDIFSHLDTNDWIRMERVSKQFQLCVNYWCRRLTYIGINSSIDQDQYCPKWTVSPRKYVFPNRILECHSDGTPCLLGNKEIMLWMSQKFQNIQYLSFGHFETNVCTLHEIMNAFHSLKELDIKDNTYGLSGEQFRQLGQLLSTKVTKLSLKIGVFCSDDPLEVIQDLPHLQSLCVEFRGNHNILKVINSLPNGIKYLELQLSSIPVFTPELAESLVDSNGKHLDYLLIDNKISEETLEIITDNMDLKGFVYKLSDNSNDWHGLQRVAQKQQNLVYLSLNCLRCLDYEDTEIGNRFSRVKTLQLCSCRVKESAFESLLKCFPALKTLVIYDTSVVCDLQANPCLTCFRQTIHLIGKFTRIRRLVLIYKDMENKTSILCQTLHEFTDLSAIHFDCFVGSDRQEYEEICRQFIADFCESSQTNPQKMFTIHVLSDISDDICAGHPVPVNLRISRSLD